MPVARRKRTRTAWTPASNAGEHAEEGERPEHSEHAGEPWQWPVDVLVGRFEGLAVEEAQDEKGRYGRGGGERNAPPPGRGQAAIREDERDRDQHREQERPGRLIPQHRPFGARESAGLLLQGIRRVGLRSTESRQQKRVRRSAASRSDDLVGAPPPAARLRTTRASRGPRAPTAMQALRASPPTRSTPMRARRTPRRRPREPRATGRTCPRDHRLTRRPDRNRAAT